MNETSGHELYPVPDSSLPLNSKWWSPLFRIVIHMFFGAIAFVLIALIAVSLNLLVNFLTKTGVSHIILTGIQLMEYAVFSADCILFVVYIFKTTTNEIRRL
jgi:hypothetical protein